MKIKGLLFTILPLLFIGASACQQQPELTTESARQIAREAYIYGFPLVMNYKTMYAYTLNKQSPEFKGDFNELGCEARVYTPEDKAVVTPNSDTPYCMGWMDIRKEPLVISVPDMEPERFYHFQLIDLYTHNFAYIGTLTTGNERGNFLIAGPDWQGEKPEGIDAIIRCETDLFFVVVRTQLMGAEDLPNVKRIQEAYQIQGLSSYLGEAGPEAAMTVNWPEWKEGDQFTPAAFRYLDAVLQFIDPVAEERPLMERFARLGIGTEAGFDMEKFDEATQKAIAEGVQEGFREIEAFVEKVSKDPLASGKIFGTRSFLTESAQSNYQLENFFLLRAVAAHMGLYGNSGKEAIYPTYLVDSEGAPLNAAEHNYTITFQEDELPPVSAFWSLTMYDAQTQLFIHNPLDRYLLNSSMLEDFVYGEDGSLTLYLQKDSPGKALEANWLPAPDGPFYVVMRLYGPKQEALSGEWVNPPAVKADRDI